MKPFELSRLGRSSIMLPRLGFGASPLGELFVKVSEARADATLEAAWNAGVRYFDTSPYYGRGMSEHRVGRFLYRQPREQVLLSTKVGRVLRAPIDERGFAIRRQGDGWVGGLNFDLRFDYSYDGVMRSYEDSLQRLGMPRIDLLIIHDLDVSSHGSSRQVQAHLTQLVTGGFRALSELKQAGLIQAIGAGVNEMGTIVEFAELFDLDFFLLALRYTLAEQDTLEQELPVCEKRGIGLIIGGAFNSGLYATGPIPGAKYNYRDPTRDEVEKVRKIERVCTSHGVPLPAAALQFPLHHPLVASVIPGGFEPEHILANIAHVQHPIPATLWSDLKQEGLIRQDAPTP